MPPPLVASTLGRDRLESVAGGFHYRVTDYGEGIDLAPHRHERAKVSAALRGRYRESYGWRLHEADRNAVLVKPAGIAHADAYQGPITTVLTIDMSPPVLEMLRPHGSLFLGPELVRLRTPLIRRMAGELERPDSVSPLALEALALDLLGLLLRRRAAPLSSATAFARACEFIDAHLGDAMPVTGVAAAAGVHPSHLTRLFRAHGGCSPARWLRNRRLEVAKVRLRTTDTPLAGIASDLGFYDQSHFTNVFRSATGTTPARWRGHRQKR